MDRRGFLIGAGAIAAAQTLACASGPASAQAQTAPPVRFADMHSHVGMGISWTVPHTEEIRAAMTRGGVVLIARKIVADEPVIAQSGNRIRAFRSARPGELWRSFQGRLDIAQELHRRQNLEEIASPEALDRIARSGTPAIALAAEGADFLEGDLKRLETVRSRGLVHLQLVHYRVSEVGDISTEAYVHNGLTAFGRQVVAECERLGILVDVAHGSTPLIDQTLEIATRPMIYSHGHVTERQPDPSQEIPRARALYLPLAKKIAEKGGVVGLWPLSYRYPSPDAYAEGLLRTAEQLGIDHVGIGTDMEGLPVSVLPRYEAFPDLAARLAKRGLKDEDVGKLMGGNYLRVLRQAISAGAAAPGKSAVQERVPAVRFGA